MRKFLLPSLMLSLESLCLAGGFESAVNSRFISPKEGSGVICRALEGMPVVLRIVCPETRPPVPNRSIRENPRALLLWVIDHLPTAPDERAYDYGNRMIAYYRANAFSVSPEFACLMYRASVLMKKRKLRYAPRYLDGPASEFAEKIRDVATQSEDSFIE